MLRSVSASAAAVVVAMSLLVPSAGAQEAPLALSLDVGSSRTALPRLGLWKDLTPRLTLGFEAESDVRTWSTRYDGRERSGADWRFAAGPSLRVALATTGDVTLYGYGHASWGNHRFAPAYRPGEEPLGEESGVGVRLGMGLDWGFADHWSAGVLYSTRWLSEDDGFAADPRGAWDSPGLGFTLRFRF